MTNDQYQDDPVSQLLASYLNAPPIPLASPAPPVPGPPIPLVPATPSAGGAPNAVPQVPAVKISAPSPVDQSAGAGIKLPATNAAPAVPSADQSAPSTGIKLPGATPADADTSDDADTSVKPSGAGQPSPSTLSGLKNAAAVENSKPGLNTLWHRTDHLNPFLKVLSRIGIGGLYALNGAGSFIAPEVLAAIPGTPLNHQENVRQAEGIANQQQARDTAQQDLADKATDSTVSQENADTGAKNAQTNLIKATNEKHNYSTVSSGGVLYTHDKVTNQLKPLLGTDGKQLTAPEAGKPDVHQLPDGSVISVERDPKTGETVAKQVYKGDPKIETQIVPLEVNGKPHSVLVDKNGGTIIKDLGETGEKPPTVNVNAGTAALDRESTRFSKAWDKHVADSNDKLEKINEAQALINGNASAQALGIPKVLTALVSGAGSGVRITQPELNAIAKARGLGDDFTAAINKLTTGKTLTATQQKQLSGVLEDYKQRVLQRLEIANEARNSINSAGSREEMISADQAGNKRLSAFSAGTSGGTYLLNGQTYNIPAEHVQEFLKDHPNARKQ